MDCLYIGFFIYPLRSQLCAAIYINVKEKKVNQLNNEIIFLNKNVLANKLKYLNCNYK